MTFLVPLPTLFDLEGALCRAAEEDDRAVEGTEGEDGNGTEGSAGRFNCIGAQGAEGEPGITLDRKKRKLEAGENPWVSDAAGSKTERDSRKWRQEARKARRNKRRKLDAEEQGRAFGGLKQVALRYRGVVGESGGFTSTNWGAESAKVAEGGWLGGQTRSPRGESQNLGELLGRGFRLIKWDGRSSTAILDKSQRVVAVMVGVAKGNFSEEVASAATAAFESESQALHPTGAECHRRGEFHAALSGVSHGGGTPVPTQTVTVPKYVYAVKRLRANKAVARLAGFQNQAFGTYFPETHAYYQRTMGALRLAREDLCFPFETVFPAAAFNLGPRTVCVPHRDAMNLSFGICCITALGRFNPANGGHLVLEELGLAIEFPPGATALIPSAVITHSNTDIQDGETRYSFTQYASGSLFAFVENGMKTDKDLCTTLSKEQRVARTQGRLNRWREGLAMFPLFRSYTELNQ